MKRDHFILLALLQENLTLLHAKKIGADQPAQLNENNKSLETVFSIAICRQMAMENYVSNDFLCMLVDSILTFLIAAYLVCLLIY